MNYGMTFVKRLGSTTVAIAAALLVGAATISPTWANNPVSGAAFTTVNEAIDGTGHCQNGNPNTNCNIYDGKHFVWLNGGPSVAYVGDGNYFFAVLNPGGQADPNDGADNNLSDDFDAYTNRTFHVTGGVIDNVFGSSHDFSNNKLRLEAYADSDNPGGVYILAICSLASGYPVNASDCKYDAFKINAGELERAPPLTISKDAAGTYDTKFAWTITKAADKTLVKQVGGSATFNYTVTVTYDGGTISGVKVTGMISVFNPIVDGSNNTVPVYIDGVTDLLSDGTVCTVTDGGAQTLTQAKTDFAYTCNLAQLPQGELSNIATVNWSEQLLDNGELLAAGPADFKFQTITFVGSQTDECVSVSDSVNGSLGTACVSGANPKSFNYSRTIPIPQFGCLSYPNTATFTTNDNGTTSSASASVTVCGPVQTGALTMGFWQNPNGQGIIKNYCGGLGTSLHAYLTGYNPFKDDTSATCAAEALYVYNVVKAANASGASMNAMLKAQMLATALDVYFSDPALGGNKIGAPAPIGGVSVDLTKICQDLTCVAYEDSSSVFGGSPKTVAQMLTYAASQSNTGGSMWYGNVKPTQELAKDAFDAINNQKVFGP